MVSGRLMESTDLVLTYTESVCGLACAEFTKEQWHLLEFLLSLERVPLNPAPLALIVKFVLGVS